jgi:histone acetyltransferase (RNA polymerase elongator complex component)
MEAVHKYSFETGVYRPPSEGGSFSLLLRITRNCPWNRCTFCGMYKDEKFELRSPEEIRRDIDAVAAIRADLKKMSWEIGQAGTITHEAAVALIGREPALNYHQGFAMVYHWLMSGGRTAFLQDANSLIMKTDALVEVLRYLRGTFPSIDRVTSYARSKTLAQKKLADLVRIREAGLDRVHLGLESGDDEVLALVKKGASAETHVKGGKKAVAAGFQVSEYWMPGLGGRALWEKHAVNTARVLSDINPHYIRSRPFRPWPGTPLHSAIANGEVRMLSPMEQLQELKLTMESLQVTSRVCFDHAGNSWKNRRGGYLFTHGYEGYQFPEEKPRVLELIEEGMACAR